MPQARFADALTFTPHQITLLMVVYGFVASVLPVWLLLEPRDYLSTYVKLGTIAVLIIGVFIVHPEHPVPGLHAVHPRRRTDHQGQAVPVPVRDHCLRRDLRLPLAGVLGHDAEDAGQGDRRALHRLRRDAVRIAGRRAGADRRLLDVSGRLFRHQQRARRCSAKLGLHTVNLDMFSREVGEKLAGRTGGAVSLAIGMAQIFRGLPGHGPR